MSAPNATRCEERPTSGITLRELPAVRRKLQALRAVGWLVFLMELSVLAVCLRFVLVQAAQWVHYLWSLAAVLAWFHGVPYLDRWLTKVAARVHPTGDRWRIGRYREAELRELVEEATGGLPPKVRRLCVCVVDVRCVAAWTWLSIFRPSADWAKPILLTSGSLHYLERDELIAVVLHEIAHHLPKNRAAVCGGWLLADVTWHAVAFRASCVTGSGSLGVLTFMLLRWMGLASAVAVSGNIGPSIEHLCDLFAAERAGSVPMINALLKMAEDGELSEVVLVWVARAKLYDSDLALEDLVLALADARPYGRIFQENLFRHAAEVSRLLQDRRKSLRNSRKSGKENPELKEFVEKRRSRQFRRIRWRRFDADEDGKLTAEEIGRLCGALLARPEDMLVTSEDEFDPTTHPRCRDRVLLLHQAHIASSLQPFPSEANPKSNERDNRTVDCAATAGSPDRQQPAT